MRTFHHLGVQLNLIIGLTLLLIACLYSAFLYNLEQQRYHQAVAQSELLLQVLIEQRLEDLANDLFGDYQSSMQLTLEQMQKVKHLLAIATYQPDGTPFSSTDSTLAETALAQRWQKAVRKEQTAFSIMQTWRGKPALMYVQHLEMIGVDIGYVQVFYDLTDLQHQRLLSLFLFVGLLLVMLLAVSLLLHRALTYLVTHPLLTLRLAMQRVANNEFVEPVKLRVNNELREMADSFNTMANAVMQSRQIIEQQVTERTAQLHRASHEIRLLNDQLHLENRRLGAELSVSRRLQSMLLPADEELMAFDALDIVGMMTPSQEVGGDYYDVFPAGNCIVFGIGDVTGHGLESGVLAMMVQTAVRTLFTQSHLSLTDCLIAVNQTVFQNAQRLHTDRTLSLALLAYNPATYQLSITGQHESVLLIRKGELIELDTFDLGFPIGLESDITEFAHLHQCELDCNDVVVLYTDGITEAEDPQQNYYALSRLKAVLQDNWQQPAMAIKQAILQDLWGFIGEEQDLLDDITLVVFKRVA